MIKVFCDICGKSIGEGNLFNNINPFHITFQDSKDKRVLLTKFKIIPDACFKWEDADICKHCIIDAINKMDDRNEHTDRSGTADD